MFTRIMKIQENLNLNLYWLVRQINKNFFKEVDNLHNFMVLIQELIKIIIFNKEDYIKVEAMAVVSATAIVATDR